jgi:hypothetical protein
MHSQKFLKLNLYVAPNKSSSLLTSNFNLFVPMQGPDTAGLSFRVGLHSGPVTGGVLRGDNARFQLFGDVR